jgi:putative transposase
MTVSRPPRLRIGDEVLLNGSTHAVAGVSATQIRLTDVTGTESVWSLADLFSSAGFRVLTQPCASLPPQGLLDSLPADVADQARWWEDHVVEVITGVPPQAGARAKPRPQFDPSTRSLRQRELAKVSELADDGHRVPLSTLQRLRLNYEKRGVWGLVDQRVAGRRATKTDERVLQAIGQAVAEETNRSTGTVGRLRRRVEQILISAHGIDPASVMPARATFYRLAEQVSAGRHTFGSARTRRSLAKRPDDPFGTVTAVRPGEWTQIDSTPLDVRVVLDNGMIDRVELTWLIDLATKTIPAAVLSSTTKAVDAALLLARSLTPEPMRPAGRTRCAWPGRCCRIAGWSRSTNGWNLRRPGR